MAQAGCARQLGDLGDRLPRRRGPLAAPAQPEDHAREDALDRRQPAQLLDGPALGDLEAVVRLVLDVGVLTSPRAISRIGSSSSGGGSPGRPRHNPARFAAASAICPSPSTSSHAAIAARWLATSARCSASGMPWE